MATQAVTADLADTFGAAYIGALIMMILYGITCLQTYFFFIHYPKDSRLTKLLVMTIWILDTFHAALVTHAIYHYLITNFNHTPALARVTWSLCLSMGINVLTAFVVQTFFTDKIHGLNGNDWRMTGPITLVVLAHFGFGIETTVGFFLKDHFNELHELNFIAALPFAIAAILSDFAITAALCFLLQHRKTTFRLTNVLINVLIIYAINRCLLTSILAVIEVIVFVSVPNSLWWLAVDFAIGKCYANSLLATLNTRQALRGKGLNDTETLGPQLSASSGCSPTTLEIAGVTPSMVARSRFSQAGHVSMAFGDASSSSASRSVELKEFKPPANSGEAPPRLSLTSSGESEVRYSFAYERMDKSES